MQLAFQNLIKVDIHLNPFHELFFIHRPWVVFVKLLEHIDQP